MTPPEAALSACVRAALAHEYLTTYPDDTPAADLAPVRHAYHAALMDCVAAGDAAIDEDAAAATYPRPPGVTPEALAAYLGRLAEANIHLTDGDTVADAVSITLNLRGLARDRKSEVVSAIATVNAALLWHHAGRPVIPDHLLRVDPAGRITSAQALATGACNAWLLAQHATGDDALRAAIAPSLGPAVLAILLCIAALTVDAGTPDADTIEEPATWAALATLLAQ